jgi:hypothetical protein
MKNEPKNREIRPVKAEKRGNIWVFIEILD